MKKGTNFLIIEINSRSVNAYDLGKIKIASPQKLVPKPINKSFIK
jgi:hypothetical protein